MKKIFICLMALVLGGCASLTSGLNTNQGVNLATDTAFVLFLNHNPSLKPAVVASLGEVKSVMGSSMTYNDLLGEISDRFPEGSDMALVGSVLALYIGSDKPLFESGIPMLDSYKKGVSDKIDRFIMLANL